MVQNPASAVPLTSFSVAIRIYITISICQPIAYLTLALRSGLSSFSSSQNVITSEGAYKYIFGVLENMSSSRIRVDGHGGRSPTRV